MFVFGNVRNGSVDMIRAIQNPWMNELVICSAVSFSIWCQIKTYDDSKTGLFDEYHFVWNNRNRGVSHIRITFRATSKNVVDLFIMSLHLNKF